MDWAVKNAWHPFWQERFWKSCITLAPTGRIPCPRPSVWSVKCWMSFIKQIFLSFGLDWPPLKVWRSRMMSSPGRTIPPFANYVRAPPFYGSSTGFWRASLRRENIWLFTRPQHTFPGCQAIKNAIPLTCCKNLVWRISFFVPQIPYLFVWSDGEPMV